MSPLLAYPILSQFPSLCLRVISGAPVVVVGLILLGLVSFAVVLACMALISQLLVHGHVDYEGIDHIRELRDLYVADILASTKECLFDLTRMVDGPDEFIFGFLGHGRAFVFPKVFPRWYKLDLPAPVARVEYDVEAEDITSVQGKVGNALEFSGHLQHTGATPSQNKRIPILPKQRKGKQPSKWVLLRLICGHDLTTIAMRNDNLYLVAFRNKSGRWFVLGDAMSEFPATVRASRIPFGGKYSDLVQGGHKNLNNYRMMNKMSMLQVVKLLANHQEKYSDRSGSEAYNTELKLAMVTVIFVLAEAARFAGILEALQQGWQATTSNNISEQHAKLVVLWAAMSHALLKYQKTQHLTRRNFKQLKKYNIKGADDAAGMLNLLLLT